MKEAKRRKVVRRLLLDWLKRLVEDGYREQLDHLGAFLLPVSLCHDCGRLATPTNGHAHRRLVSYSRSNVLIVKNSLAHGGAWCSYNNATQSLVLYLRIR